MKYMSKINMDRKIEELNTTNNKHIHSKADYALIEQDQNQSGHRCR